MMATELDAERSDLLAMLGKQRHFLRYTTRDLTDEQARERWSARRVLMHIIAETAQHAGHADILREAIDGAKSMG